MAILEEATVAAEKKLEDSLPDVAVGRSRQKIDL
jgi:hypothetical protein